MVSICHVRKCKSCTLKIARLSELSMKMILWFFVSYFPSLIGNTSFSGDYSVFQLLKLVGRNDSTFVLSSINSFSLHLICQFSRYSYSKTITRQSLYSKRWWSTDQLGLGAFVAFVFCVSLMTSLLILVNKRDLTK